MILAKRKEIVYRTVEPQHRDAVLAVLTEAFVNEPSTAGCSLGRPSYDQWHRFTDFFMDECIANGLSVAAFDEDNGQTVAGAFINRDFLRPLPPGLETFIQDPSPFAPIVETLVTIDEAWFAQHPEIERTEIGRVADLWMLGVSPVYSRRGIASQLTELSLRRVRQAGFEFAIVECTGAYSQRTMERAGCACISELPYTKLIWKGQAVFRNVAEPHSKWAIYEKDLQVTGQSPSPAGARGRARRHT
jgi:GNAT superfamily N-acetyltransferase